MRGKFIVFEGGDGAGKDTQIELLKGVVSLDEYVFVKDPRSTDAGVRLREVVLHSEHIGYVAELMTFLAARAQLVEELIIPALAVGKNVVANRFDLSTIAYQIYGRERKDMLPFIQEAMKVVLQGIQPDIVILLDVPPVVGLERAATVNDTDRFEEEKASFHERVREGYLKHAGNYPVHCIIDATLSREEVHRQVTDALGIR